MCLILSSNSRIIKNNFIFAAILQAKDNNGENYIDDFIKYNKIAIIISKKTKKTPPNNILFLSKL